MWRTTLFFLVISYSLGAKVEGKFRLRQKYQGKLERWTDLRGSKQVKRDALPSLNGYPSYQQMYATQTSSEQTSYNTAAYNTDGRPQSRSAMPYPASPSSFSASNVAASNVAASTPSNATAPALADASPPSPAAAPAPAPAPVPSPATPVHAPPAVAAAAPASASAASPASAPAPAASQAPPAVAAAASSAPGPIESSARATVAYPATSPYQTSSTSYAYNVIPAQAPAPYYASYPAPATYAYPASSPSATTLLAAAVAQVAKSTSSQGVVKAHARSNNVGAVCMDDERASNFCLKAKNPCFCEENHHFMYNYCKDSCNWCDSSENVGHKFWRLVNEDHLDRSWVIKHVRFYSDKNAKKPLTTSDPRKAFASSSYLGYEPGGAFDNKSTTYWLPNGWYDRSAGEDFIGYEFPEPVAVNSIRIAHQSGQGDVVSKKVFVEAADSYGGPYTTKWIIENPKAISNKRFNNKMCPLFWRRFSTDQGTYCFKLITEFTTWHEARDKCAEYGADLASIRGEEEAEFVKNQVQLCGYTWIGLNDIKNESNFEWSDGGNMTYQSMASQMDYMKDERADQEMDCIAADQNGQWTNFHCDDKFYCLCKTKLKPEDEEDEEDNDDDDEERHHHKHHKDGTKYHRSHKTKHTKLHKQSKVTLAEELKEARASNNSEEDEESDVDAIREAIGAQKKARQPTPEDEENEADDENKEDNNEVSGSGSGKSASNNEKKWEF